MGAASPQNQSLKDSPAYKQLIQDFSKEKKKGSLACFLLNQKAFGVLGALPIIKSTSFFRTDSIRAKLLLDQTVMIGGHLVSTPQKLGILVKHSLSKGFLKDKKVIDFQFDFIDFTKIASSKNGLSIRSLRLNHMQGKKVVHLSSLFHVDDFWNTLRKPGFLSVERLLTWSLGSGSKETQLYSFKKVLQPHLKGNISVVLPEPAYITFPPSFDSLDFIISVGVKKRGASVLKKNIEKYLKKFFKLPQMKVKKENSQLWEVTWTDRTQSRQRQRKRQLSKNKNPPLTPPRVTKSFFLFISDKDEELTITSQKKYLSMISRSSKHKNKKSNVIKANRNILSANAKETSGIVLIDLANIYSLLQKSQIGLMFPQYIDYLKYTNKIVIHSFQRGDDIYSELGLSLKP